jgi:integrase
MTGEVAPMPKKITRNRGGRPATGSVLWKKGQWWARVTIADGTRPVVPLDPGIPREEVARARACAAEVAGRATNAVSARTRVTFAEWSVRWLKARERARFASVRDDRSHLRLHVTPILGPLGMERVTRDHIERVVADLDRKVRLPDGHEEKFSWKTAWNVWATLRKALDDAAHGKDRELRVLDESPAEKVRGPDRGVRKAKQYLYPDEFLKFVTCEEVPLRWRRAVAVAIYLYPRDGELRIMRWEDGSLDLDHGVAHIHRAYDRRARAETTTKTGGTRRFNFEPALLPLLEAMREEAGEVGPVVPMPSERDMSRGLRRWLRKAGVTRPELFTSSATSKPITFHDLRATGITWCAIRGDEPFKIMHCAGHRRLETTQLYVREAVNLRAGFGQVFPTLPDALLGVSSEFRLGAETPNRIPFFLAAKLRGGRDSNPRPPA